MKKVKRTVKYFDLNSLDLTGYEEVTGNELFLINGGRRTSNSNIGNITSVVAGGAATGSAATLAVTNSQSNTPAQTQTQSAEQTTSNNDTHTVQSGDTLSQIVYDYNKEHGTNHTVSEIAQNSGIENPDLIRPGETISFGNRSETVPESNGNGNVISNSRSSSYTGSGNNSSSNNSSTNSNSSSQNNDYISISEKKMQKLDERVSSSTGSTSSNTVDYSQYEYYFDGDRPPENKNFKTEGKTVIVDINDEDAIDSVCNAFERWYGRGYTELQFKDGDKVVNTATNVKDAIEYVNEIAPVENDLSTTLGNISTGSYVISEVLDDAITYFDDAAKIAKLTKYSKFFSKISSYSGKLVSGIDLINAYKNPCLDTVSDVAIDIIGLLPGGTLFGLGLTSAKYFGKELEEKIEDSVEYYKDFKLQEFSTCFSDVERQKLTMKLDFQIIKYEENLVKQVFPVMRFYP